MISVVQQLMEQQISRIPRPPEPNHRQPIRPRPAETPIIPMDRWVESQGALYKTYAFRRLSDRSSFVMALLSYEEQVQHSASIQIEPEHVSLKLQTHDLGKATEIDREYARYADLLFRDLVSRPGLGSDDDGDQG